MTLWAGRVRENCPSKPVRFPFKLRPPSNRAINDEILLDHIKRVHRDNYSCYGVRKVWYSLLDDVEVLIKPGRDQVARLMRRAGLRGDRKSTRLNSSHVAMSYAVFCLE